MHSLLEVSHCNVWSTVCRTETSSKDWGDEAKRGEKKWDQQRLWEDPSILLPVLFFLVSRPQSFLLEYSRVQEMSLLIQRRITEKNSRSREETHITSHFSDSRVSSFLSLKGIFLLNCYFSCRFSSLRSPFALFRLWFACNCSCTVIPVIQRHSPLSVRSPLPVVDSSQVSLDSKRRGYIDVSLEYWGVIPLPYSSKEIFRFLVSSFSTFLSLHLKESCKHWMLHDSRGNNILFIHFILQLLKGMLRDKNVVILFWTFCTFRLFSCSQVVLDAVHSFVNSFLVFHVLWRRICLNLRTVRNTRHAGDTYQIEREYTKRVPYIKWRKDRKEKKLASTPGMRLPTTMQEEWCLLSFPLLYSFPIPCITSHLHVHCTPVALDRYIPQQNLKLFHN